MSRPADRIPPEPRSEVSELSTRERRLDECLQRIRQAPDFPAFSRQMQELMSQLVSDEASVQLLVNLVLRDYSLTLKLLRTANTLHYNRSGRPVRSATHALLLIGARAVRDLASSMLVFEHYHRQTPALKELLLLSLLSANHARELAVRLGLADPEVAHLCGMFRNLGEVLLAYHCPDDYARACALQREQQVARESAELRVLGFTSTDLGVAMAQWWGMPDEVRAGMRAGTGRGEPLLSRVAVAAQALTDAVYRADAAPGDLALADLEAGIATPLGLSRAELGGVIDAAAREARAIFADAHASLDDGQLARRTRAALSRLNGAGAEQDAAASDDAALATLRRQLLGELANALPRAGEGLHEAVLMILEAAFRGGPLDHAVFCLFDAERSELRGRFGLGDGAEALVARLRVSTTTGEGTLGAALLRGRDVLLGGERPATREESLWLQRLGARGAAFFALSAHGTPVGALYLACTHEPLSLDAGTAAYLGQLREAAMRALVARRATSLDSPAPAPRAAPAERLAAVLRALRGEPLGAVAAEHGVAPDELERWQAAFLAAGAHGLGADPPAPAAVP